MSTVGRPTAAHACSTPCASKATGSVVAGCAGSCANRACRLMCPGGPPYDRQPARAAHRPKPAGRTNLGPGAGPLDFDSTVFLLRRKAGGPCKRFTPRHEGATAILNCRWCGPRRAVRFARLAAQSEHGRGAPFLHKTLTLLPKKPSSSRCASIAVALRGAFLNFLEERELPSVVAVRTKNLQRKCAESKAWNDIDEHRHAGQFTVQLFGWTEARRLVVVRERMRESKPRWAAICRMCRATPFGSG